MPRRPTIIARVGVLLRGGHHTPWSPTELATLAGIEVHQAAWACRMLVQGKCAVRVSGNRRRGCLYQWIVGSVVPEDGRGRHAAHPAGKAWTVRRKQRAALSKARQRKQREASEQAPVVAGSLADFIRGSGAE